MSIATIILTVLGCLVGLFLLRRAVVWLGSRWLVWLAARHNLCERCYVKPRNYIFNDDNGAPLNVCEPCAKETLSPYAMGRMQESGRLVKVS